MTFGHACGRGRLVPLIKNVHLCDQLYDDSYAPMSHMFSDPSGRGLPRWSVVIVMELPEASVRVMWHASTGMASIATLPGSNARVWVGPPLLRSIGSILRSESVTCWSVTDNPLTPVLSWIRL